LRGPPWRRTLAIVDLDELLSRPEVVATLFAVQDINVKLSRIIRLLEGDDDGEAWPPEDDT
jgi:hypothetical protein